MVIRILSVLIFILGLGACQSASIKNSASIGEDSNLSQVEAQNRKNRLGDIAYQISVTLGEKDKSFTGLSEINFNLKDNSSDLRIEFYEGEISALNLNGQSLDLSAKKKYWIELPAKYLKVGKNLLIIKYSHDYATDGQGLHRFVDPETKEVFLYTQFETFDANRFMPCFDQPDLKATYELKVTAPKKWSVISTTLESSQINVGETLIWNFPPTQKISTYLFSLHAGPYKVWKDQFEDVPLRLFARPSLAKYVDAKEWFKVTKQGLKFFNFYYSYAYPFKKYDQIIVPEFNAGAMENVGAVTFSEFLISKSKPTRTQKRRLASVTLHEMAHMWFGDIVTMNWWNDLWLNESFATYMQQLSMKEATEYQESWLDFFTSTKLWAYWQDRLITSHPIEGSIPTVKDAFASFDGITYGKGASVLKQLKAYIGAEAFQAGIADYIKTNAFGNATRADFIAALQRHSDKDLSLWAERWLKQSHTDTLSAIWKCEGDSLNQIELELTSSPGTQFRPQTVQVGLFESLSGNPKLLKSISLTLNSAKEILKGPWKCPAMVYPNYQDDGFASINLDPATLAFVKEHLNQIPDDLLRAQVWFSLWEMVLRAEISLKEFIAVMDRHFPLEKNEIVLRQVLYSTNSMLYYWPENEKELPAKMAFINHLESDYLKRFQNSKAGSDEQKLWFDNYASVARSPKALKQLSAWNQKDQIAAGFPLDPDRRWGLVNQLMRYQTADARKALALAKKKDSSDRGQKYSLSAEAAWPSLEVKQKYVEAIKPLKGSYSFQELSFISRGLFPYEQQSLQKNFENDFYTYLRLNGSAEDENHVMAVSRALMPLHCEKAASDKLKAYVDSSKNLTPGLRKQIWSSIDEDERCQRVRAKSF